MGYIEVKDAVKQANSTREQYVAGFEAAGNAAVKSTVTGVAGFGGGVVGGLAGGATPVPGGTAAGAIGLGGAAAYGAGAAYEDSMAQNAVKAVSRAAGEFGYDHISKEGRLAGEIRDIQAQLSQTSDATKQRELQQQLNQTTTAFNVEADKNQRQIISEHILEAQRADIKAENPKVWNVSLDSQLDRAVEQGYSGDAAVRKAVGDALARDTNVSATHADKLRDLATSAEFNAKQANIQTVTDSLTAARDAQYARETREWNARQAKVQEVTDTMTAARHGELPPLNRQTDKPHHARAPELGIGAHGSNVKHVQEALNLLGAGLVADGHYGKETAEAVKVFQREHHLKVDGTIGVKDAKVMGQALKAHTHEQQTTPITQTHTSEANTVNHINTTQPQPAAEQLEQMRSIMAQNPVFASLSPEQQTAMLASLATASQAAVQQTAPIAPTPAQSTAADSVVLSGAPVQTTVQPEPALQMASQTASQPMPQPTPQPAVASYSDASQQTSQSSAPQMAQPTADSMQLTPKIAKLHEQITQHLTQGQFGNQIAHLSETEQQAAIALATHEATRNLARSVDYVFVNKEGKMCMSFDGDKGFSAETSLQQAQSKDAVQLLTASLDLQQNHQQAMAQRQEQSKNQGGPTMTMWWRGDEINRFFNGFFNKNRLRYE